MNKKQIVCRKILGFSDWYICDGIMYSMVIIGGTLFIINGILPILTGNLEASIWATVSCTVLLCIVHMCIFSIVEVISIIAFFISDKEEP